MKKILFGVLAVLCSLTFVGCKNTNANKDLAKSIENKTTNLVYSVETMDKLEVSEIESIDTSSTEKQSSNNTNIGLKNLFTTKTFIESTFLSPKQKRMKGSNPKPNVIQKNTSENKVTSKSKKTNTTNNTTAKNTQKNINKTSNNVSAPTANSTNSVRSTHTMLSSVTQNTNESSENYITNKRSELMLMCSKLRKGDIKTTKKQRSIINESLALIENTTNYLNTTKGDINKLKESAQSEMDSYSKRIQLKELLSIRQAKLDTCTMAMDQIIESLGGKTSENSQASTQNSTDTTKNSSLTIQNTNNNNGNNMKSSNSAISSVQSVDTNSNVTEKQVPYFIATIETKSSCPDCSIVTNNQTTNTNRTTNTVNNSTSSRTNKSNNTTKTASKNDPINPITRSGKSQMVSNQYPSQKTIGAKMFRPKQNRPIAQPMPHYESFGTSQHSEMSA